MLVLIGLESLLHWHRGNSCLALSWRQSWLGQSNISALKEFHLQLFIVFIVRESVLQSAANHKPRQFLSWPYPADLGEYMDGFSKEASAVAKVVAGLNCRTDWASRISPQVQLTLSREYPLRTGVGKGSWSFVGPFYPLWTICPSWISENSRL